MSRLFFCPDGVPAYLRSSWSAGGSVIRETEKGHTQVPDCRRWFDYIASRAMLRAMDDDSR